MSKADIEKFVSDLKSNPDLLEEVKQSAGGLQSVVELAKGKGYDISLDEAKAYIQDKAGATLSDDQLDALAGGKQGYQPSPVVGTNVAQVNEVVVQVEGQMESQTQIQVILDGGIAASTVT